MSYRKNTRKPFGSASAKTIILLGVTACLLGSGSAFAQAGNPTKQADRSSPADEGQSIIAKHLEDFARTGVPTAKIVDAAFAKAKADSTIENWLLAAELATKYATTVEVLNNLYYKQDREEQASRRSIGLPPSRSDSLPRWFAYSTTVLTYLDKRNDAYVEVAKLYMSKGEMRSALAYALAAVQLSTKNEAAATLVRQLIEYVE